MRKAATPRYLSDRRPGAQEFHPNYAGIPYHERRRWAENHADKLLPSIQGLEPWGRLVKVVFDCIRHYGMSDRTTWEIVRDHFNPRCRHEDGSRYPWKKGSVVKAIEWAHEPEAFSTMVGLDKLANPWRALARLRKKGRKANERRRERNTGERRRREALMAEALHDLEYVSITGDSENVRPFPHLRDGCVVFRDLLEEVGAQLAERGEQAPSEKAFGTWLRKLGLETYRGRIRTKQTTNEQKKRAA